MNQRSDQPLITTIEEKCRICYTCVRECSAKAIRISNGQAEVIYERCIGCGNCVRVCSQNAKDVRNSIPAVKGFLESHQKVILCMAPSFPAEFHDIPYKMVVGMLKSIGFSLVTEVAFGADLVAKAYKKLFKKEWKKKFITTACPSIVSYIEKYHPTLVSYLAPIVSPMIAMAKVLKVKYGTEHKIVFVGPCIAKKDEALKKQHAHLIDEVLTFKELRQLMDDFQPDWDTIEPCNFDPPHGGTGMIFPIGRGILQAACLNDDLMTNTIVAASGGKKVIDAIKEFEHGDLRAQLLDLLCCNGCIMGAGFSNKITLYNRQAKVSNYARERYAHLDLKRWKSEMHDFMELNLSCSYTTNDKRSPLPKKEDLLPILQEMGKSKPEDELNCRACGYTTCLEHATAIYWGFAENQMCLPYTIEKLKDTANELRESYSQLTSTKQALMQSEKLTSMGQFAAGIAHEVNNPLGVVLMYSHLLLNEIDQQSELYSDVKMIADQADRCKKIVSGLLNFARKNKVIFKNTPMDDFLSHCLDSIPIPENIQFRYIADDRSLVASIDPDQMSQVISNLVLNAFEAMPSGGMLTISSSDQDPYVKITIKDTGIGIKKENVQKIFEPFFTTKQIGKGTGLGLAVTYGIIKMHKGRIEVISNDDPGKGETGTSFAVYVPKKSDYELNAVNMEGAYHD